MPLNILLDEKRNIFYSGCYCAKQARVMEPEGEKKDKEEHDYILTVRVLAQNKIHNIQIYFQDLLVGYLLPTVKLCDSRSRERNLALLSPITQSLPFSFVQPHDPFYM